jgi:hypothetical protein
MKRGRPKKQHGYLRAAAKAFLEGTRCRTPEEAVLKGVRSLEAWADALREAKEGQDLRFRTLRIQPGTSSGRGEKPSIEYRRDNP